MKKLIQFTIAALVLGLVASATAQLVPDPVTLDARAATFRDTDIQEDQSKIPDQSDRVGYLSFTYSVPRDGGTGVIDIGPLLPVGTAVRGGFVQTTTAVLPETATSAVHVVSANDLLPAGRNMQATGVTLLNVASASYATDPAGSTNTVLSLKAPLVTTASARQVKLTWSGSTATTGVFQIYLDLVKVQ